MSTIDFNCDLGEGMGDDAAILPFVSSANIATGGHAGDADSMRETIRLCLQHGVAIGAHPSFVDREHFGRRPLALPPEVIRAQVAQQLAVFQAVVDESGARLHHVKPHGALYNLAAGDPQVAAAIAQAVHDHDPGLLLYGLSGSALPCAGEALGLRVAHEVFAERRYEADGQLTPRSHPDASLDTVEAALLQVLQLMQGTVQARTGETLVLRADTLCLHGDRPQAAQFARELRRALQAGGHAVHALE